MDREFLGLVIQIAELHHNAKYIFLSASCLPGVTYIRKDPLYLVLSNFCSK
jgi:hypothetical protein